MMNTPIRQMMAILQTNEERTHVAEGSGPEAYNFAGARVWARHRDALAIAIVSEPPQDIFEVVAVLENLHSVMFESFATIDQLNDREAAIEKARELSEICHTALCNSIARLGHVVEMDYDKGPSINRLEVDYYHRQMRNWLSEAAISDLTGEQEDVA